jgi:protein-disulfide isomerase
MGAVEMDAANSLRKVSMSAAPPGWRLLIVSVFASLLAISSFASGQEPPAPAPAIVDGQPESDLDALRREVDVLRRGQDAIWQSLEEIKALLRQGAGAQRPTQNAQQAPPNVIIDLAGRPIQGSAEARLAVVEFSDYQCPYCARHTRDTFTQLERNFIDNGKVRYAMLDLPLRTHPLAFKAAEAASCAAVKGKFWEMHDLLFEKQDALQPEALPGYAEQVGLDRGEFEACLESGKADAVKADLAQASQAGISATPTFLVGWLGPGDQLKPAEVIRGAQPYASFERVLNQLLEQGPPSGDGG